MIQNIQGGNPWIPANIEMKRILSDVLESPNAVSNSKMDRNILIYTDSLRRTRLYFQKRIVLDSVSGFFAKDIKHTLDKSYKPVGPSDSPEPIAEATKPFSVLLLGVDQREDEPARSDTIIFSVIRPDLNKILLVSIPRDTYTEVIGRSHLPNQLGLRPRRRENGHGYG